jgi:hypothetical protein
MARPPRAEPPRRLVSARASPARASVDGYIERVEGSQSMVHREKVTDAKGRAWVSGALDSDVYFADVRRKAREQAARMIAARIRSQRLDPRGERRTAPAQS